MTKKNEFILDISFHPGETLAGKLEEIDMSSKEFSDCTGVPEEMINKLLMVEGEITPDMAVSFEDVLKIPASFWLKRQYKYDEYIGLCRKRVYSLIQQVENFL